MTDIIHQMLNSADFMAAMLFCSAAVLGQVSHSVKKWGEGEAPCAFYYLTTSIRRTVGAVFGNVGAMVVFIQSGVLGPMMGLPNGWWAITLFGFMNGFSANSALNRVKKDEGA